MTTDSSTRSRIGRTVAAGVSLLGVVAVLGLSIVAGLVLLLPLLFVGLLARTAYRHYFGRSEMPEAERI